MKWHLIYRFRIVDKVVVLVIAGPLVVAIGRSGWATLTFSRVRTAILALHLLGDASDIVVIVLERIGAAVQVGDLFLDFLDNKKCIALIELFII